MEHANSDIKIMPCNCDTKKSYLPYVPKLQAQMSSSEDKIWTPLVTGKKFEGSIFYISIISTGNENFGQYNFFEINILKVSMHPFTAKIALYTR
jgi:hypothetical protein